MHVLSKVLLGVVVVMAIVAVILTSKLRMARGGWLEKIDQRQAQLETLREDLRTKKLEVSDARAEINRLLSRWGDSWPGVQGQVVDPQAGRVGLNVGGNQGIGHPGGEDVPPLFLFAQSPQEEGTQYLGEFRPTGIQAAQTAARMTRQPYPGEVQNWPQQTPWRTRERIPSSYRALFAKLDADTATALQDVQDQNARLEKADELNAKSQEQLQRRLGQLEGRPEALEGSAPEVIDGLVESLRKNETDRNAQLGELDDLRHEYDRKYRRLQSLIEQNRQLEQSLPQSGAPESTPGSGQQAVETSTQATSR